MNPISMNDVNSLIQQISIGALPILLAITLHEVAHGWAALRFGDHTAQALGRLTLNPLRHIDPIGTVLIPLLALVVGGFLFGWAKPVPVDYRNLRDPRRDMIWIAAAGPAANLLMAIVWLWLAKLAVGGGAGPFAEPLQQMATIGISINISLMVLNLLPLPPLDGGRILLGLLPVPLAMQVARVEPFGFIILLGLMVTGLLGILLQPFYTVAVEILKLFA